MKNRPVTSRPRGLKRPLTPATGCLSSIKKSRCCSALVAFPTNNCMWSSMSAKTHHRNEHRASRSAPICAWPTVTTKEIGRGLDRIEVVHDGVHCYGFFRTISSRDFEAWWSGDHFDDHPLGNFETRAAALEAVAATKSEVR
jgi:hypothetical protein